MSNFIYYEHIEDYEEQVRKAKLCDEKDKEIERLNNIINELENYVIENSFGSPIHNTCVIELSKVLDKIKELKG